MELQTPDFDQFPCGCLITTGMVTPEERKIVYGNAYFYRELGCLEGSLIGQPFAALFTPASRIIIDTYMTPMLKHSGRCEEILLEIRRPSGAKVPVVVNAIVHPSDQSRIHWSLFSAVERDRLYQELVDMRRLFENEAANFKRLSSTDSLTGLLNRRELHAQAALAVAQARRLETDLAVLVMDIDHFKKINDALGHAEGDRILEKLGELLREQGREADIIARYGGEEFVVVLSGADKLRAEAFAGRLHDIAGQIPVEGKPLTVSIGIGLSSEHPNFSYDLLFRTADQALYQAKNQGRNQTAIC